MDSDGLIRIYLFTEIQGMKGQLHFHDWYLENERVARVEIRPSVDPMRASSAKYIDRHMLGDWRVEVVTEEGELLAKGGRFQSSLNKLCGARPSAQAKISLSRFFQFWTTRPTLNRSETYSLRSGFVSGMTKYTRWRPSITPPWLKTCSGATGRAHGAGRPEGADILQRRCCLVPGRRPHGAPSAWTRLIRKCTSKNGDSERTN
ncbi:DUF2914 domain-containing protein [Marinobacter halophilus]